MSSKAGWGWILAVAAIAAGVWFSIGLSPDGDDRVVLDRVIDLCSLHERQIRTSPDPEQPIPGELILEKTPRPFLLVPTGQAVEISDVPIHPKARLEAYLGVDPESWRAHPVPIRFSVEVLAQPDQVLDRFTTTLQPGDDRWRQIEMELPSERSSVELILRAEAAGDPPIRCGLGSPVIRSAGEIVPRSEATTPNREPILDLVARYAQADVTPASDRLQPRVASISLGSEKVEGSGEREVILAPPPSRIEWQVELPPDAALLVDLGIARSEAASDGVTFRVRLGETLLLERSLSAKHVGAWVAVRVRLTGATPFAGKLSLETDAGPAGDAGGDAAAWAGALIQAEVGRAVPPAATPERPSVILITVDTLRADRLSCYGYERATSPNLDAFAAAGRLFEKATAPSSWTWPSTATLLTGRTPPAHGVNDGNSSYLAESLDTLAEHLRHRGLLTYGVTANPLVGPEKNFDQGFGVFDTVPWSSAATVNERFLHWLDSRPDMRFFAYLHYFDPHSPYEDPRDPEGALYDPSYNGSFDGQSINELIAQINWNQPPDDGPIEFSERDIRHLSARYDGCINYWDEQFGRLVAALKERGAWDDALVIVTSDHGEAFLEHGLIAHVSSLYEEVLHVPLIVGGGAYRGAPSREKKLIGLTAILPTVLKRSGAPVEMSLPGLDLLGPSPGVDVAHATTLLGRYGPERKISPMGMIRTQDRKLIVTTAARTAELYDLEHDPAEQEDRSAREPERVDRLRDNLVEWTTSESERAPRYRSEVDEDLHETLKRLGYAGRSAPKRKKE